MLLQPRPSCCVRTRFNAKWPSDWIDGTGIKSDRPIWRRSAYTTHTSFPTIKARQLPVTSHSVLLARKLVMRHGRFLSAHADKFGTAGAIRAVYRKIHLYDVPMVGLVESQQVVLLWPTPGAQQDCVDTKTAETAGPRRLCRDCSISDVSRVAYLTHCVTCATVRAYALRRSPAPTSSAATARAGSSVPPQPSRTNANGLSYPLPDRVGTLARKSSLLPPRSSACRQLYRNASVRQRSQSAVELWADRWQSGCTSLGAAVLLAQASRYAMTCASQSCISGSCFATRRR
jgi:hypothetical protein